MPAVRKTADPFEAWLRARTVRDVRAETPARELYDDYVSFCRASGADPLSPKVWGRRMGKQGFERVQRRVSGRRTRVWQGVCLR